MEKPLCKLKSGDIIVSYLKKHGYVGIGRVVEKAVPVLEFMYNDKPLKEQKLIIPNIYEHSGTVNSEYSMKVVWLKTVGSQQAKWRPKSGLYIARKRANHAIFMK